MPAGEDAEPDPRHKAIDAGRQTIFVTGIASASVVGSPTVTGGDGGIDTGVIQTVADAFFRITGNVCRWVIEGKIDLDAVRTLAGWAWEFLKGYGGL